MNTPLPQNAAVWFEIPVGDFERAVGFYQTVLACQMRREQVPNPMAFFPVADENGVAGHLYPGRPAAEGTGPTIHLAVADLEAALARVVPAGGKVVSDPIAIPAGRFAYCLDPDGNSFGLFG